MTKTITLQINDPNALETLRDLETRHLISILEPIGSESPALPGSPLSLREFENWINGAENTPSTPLHQAKEKWESKRKQLRGSIYWS